MPPPISLSAESWLRTGRIDQITIGSSVDDVTRILGEPRDAESKTNPDGFPSLWRYDDFEFGFDTSEIVASITAYLWGDTEEFIRTDWQGIAAGMLIDDCRKWLLNRGLPFHEEYYDYGAELTINNQTQMSFSPKGYAKLTDSTKNEIMLTVIGAPPLKTGERVDYAPGKREIVISSEIYDFLIEAKLKNTKLALTFDDGDKYSTENLNLCFETAQDGTRTTEPIAVEYRNCMFYARRRLRPQEVENARADGDLSSDETGSTGKIYGVDNIVLIWDYNIGYAVFEKK